MSGANALSQSVGPVRRRARGERGFTLIEVMISVAIFAFGILAVSRMQMLGLRGHSYNESYGTASHFAMEMFETLNNYARTPANFVNGVFQLPQAAVATWQQAVSTALGPSANPTVGAVQFDPLTQMNKVTVSVGWSGGHTVALTTYLAGQL